MDSPLWEDNELPSQSGSTTQSRSGRKLKDGGVNVPVNPPSVAAKTDDPFWP